MLKDGVLLWRRLPYVLSSRDTLFSCRNTDMELRRKEPAARRREKRFFDQFRCQSGKIVLNRADRQRVVPDYLIIVEASEKEVAIFPVAGLQQTVSASDGERVVHIMIPRMAGKS